MSRFQERLWQELVADHGAALAYPQGLRDPLRPLPILEPRRPAARRLPALLPDRLRLRPSGLAATLAALVATVAAVAILSTTGTAPSAAYAVTQNPDGTIKVSIDELTGVTGANAQLAKLGVRVTVVPVQAGCSSVGLIAPMNPSLAATVAHIEGQGVTIQPKLIPAGDTLVLAARQIGSIVGLGYKLYQGAAPTCVPSGDSHAH